VARFRFRYPDEAGVWHWRKVDTLVTQGKKVGTYVGRVAVRATGFFNITTGAGTIECISHRYCHRIYRVDGYSYQLGRRTAFPPVA
jgi:predicted histidine transporter YuiF (NhaC family)